MTTSPPPRDPRDPRDQAIAGWVREHRTPGEPMVDVDAAWSRFAGANAVPAPAARRERRFTTAWRVAAGILFVAGVGYWGIRSRGDQMVERVTANGERATVTLDDGSRITLNGGSRLRYAARASARRDLYLEGEAFFEVTHDPSRTFRVHAGRAVVEDIGTKFDVQAYDSTSVEVAVAEGAVALRGPSATAAAVELRAGEVGVVDSTGAALKISGEPLDRHVGWTTGALIFDNVTLADAARAIEHRYGVRVLVADPVLARRRVMGRFHDESVAQILDALTLAMGARYDAQGTTYTLRGSGK